MKRSRLSVAAHSDVAPLLMEDVTHFGENPGQLRMLQLVPASLKQRAPLVVVLHGSAQRAEVHAHEAGWPMLARRHGFAVLAPEQRPLNNMLRSFNWFEPGDATRGLGEAASIHAMIAHIIDAHALDERRVFIAGMSSGGAMTSVMLGLYPELFAGGAIIAGLPFGAATSYLGAFRAMRSGVQACDAAAQIEDIHGSRLPRISIWHGDKDHTVHPSNASHIARQWATAYGVAFEEGKKVAIRNRERTSWVADDRGVVIQLNIVRGLGHGTPLSTLDDCAVGEVGPYMLEAGISSASEIVRYWKLAETGVKWD